MNSNVVLFDMDGTLTEARKSFSPFLSSTLRELASVAEIGIVTGSDFDYVKEQMSSVLEDHSIRYSLHILPCNGTNYYRPPEFPSEECVSVHSVSMEEEIGRKNYRKLMEVIIECQHHATEYDIPLTGNFIVPRGSMINWSPSGRNANDSQRALFKKFDKKWSFRKQMHYKLSRLVEFSGINNVIIKLGGDTSFDIYPDGWDKTYALRHFSGKNVWFVGDRARSPKGNDYEIFKACEPRSFHTDGPEHTKEIIEKIIKKIQED